MKNFTKMIAMVMALCLIAVGFAACTPNDGESSTDTTAAPTTTKAEVIAYYFTVVLADTKEPVADVQVNVCKGADFCLLPMATDAAGKVTYDYITEYGVYDIHIDAETIPEGYSFDNDAFKTSADVFEYTLELTKNAE